MFKELVEHFSHRISCGGLADMLSKYEVDLLWMTIEAKSE